MAKNKKSQVSKTLVGLIIALFVLAFLIYRVFISQEQGIEVADMIKNSLFG